MEHNPHGPVIAPAPDFGAVSPIMGTTHASCHCGGAAHE